MAGITPRGGAANFSILHVVVVDVRSSVDWLAPAHAETAGRVCSDGRNLGRRRHLGNVRHRHGIGLAGRGDAVGDIHGKGVACLVRLEIERNAARGGHAANITL